MNEKNKSANENNIFFALIFKFNSLRTISPYLNSSQLTPILYILYYNFSKIATVFLKLFRLNNL